MKNFLETEIIDQVSIDYFLGFAKNHKNNGARGQTELTGNAYSVSIKEDHVEIENIWDESESLIELTLDEYIRIIEEFIG